MISDWRGDRRIGTPSLADAMRGELPALLLTVGAAAVAGVLVFFIKLAFGEVRTVHGGVTMWSIVFLVVGEGIALQALLNRRWVIGLTGAAVIALLGFIAMRFATPAFMAVVCAQTACIYPVTP